LPKKKDHINKTRHTTVISYILNFIQHYFVEVNSIVDKLLSVDFNGTAQLLIIYSALIKKKTKVNTEEEFFSYL
jgi:hypothetical protein